jgi:hypothetical protein
MAPSGTVLLFIVVVNVLLLTTTNVHITAHQSIMMRRRIERLPGMFFVNAITIVYFRSSPIALNVGE